MSQQKCPNNFPNNCCENYIKESTVFLQNIILKKYEELLQQKYDDTD